MAEVVVHSAALGRHVVFKVAVDQLEITSAEVGHASAPSGGGVSNERASGQRAVAVVDVHSATREGAGVLFELAVDQDRTSGIDQHASGVVDREIVSKPAVEKRRPTTDVPHAGPSAGGAALNDQVFEDRVTGLSADAVDHLMRGVTVENAAGISRGVLRAPKGDGFAERVDRVTFEEGLGGKFNHVSVACRGDRGIDGLMVTAALADGQRFRASRQRRGECEERQNLPDSHHPGLQNQGSRSAQNPSRNSLVPKAPGRDRASSTRPSASVR